MTITNRREWLAATSSYLLSACGGSGGGSGPTSVTLTLSGPSSGVVSVTSTNFTVSASGPVAATIVVTPSSGGGSGTFAPTSVTLTPLAPAATFTYTPSSTGAKAISVTNDQGLPNPAIITYTVTSTLVNPTFTNLASNKGADNVASQSTASVTIPANRLALLSIRNPLTIPTVAGWTLVATHVVGSISRVSVFRRMVTSNLTTTPVIDFGGQVQSFNRWSIDLSSANVNTTGTNGSGAIVQAATNGETGPVGTVGTYVSVTLAAFSSQSNSVFAAFGGSVFSATPTAGSGFTELSRAGVELFGNGALFVEYKAAADTTADMSWSATYDVWTGVAVEIAAGTGP